MDLRDIGEGANRKPTWTIGEVAYEGEGKRLTVAVSGALSKDGLVSDVLIGILATAPEHAVAVRQIHAVSGDLGWAVEIDHGATVDVVILNPIDTDAH